MGLQASIFGRQLAGRSLDTRLCDLFNTGCRKFLLCILCRLCYE